MPSPDLVLFIRLFMVPIYSVRVLVAFLASLPVHWKEFGLPKFPIVQIVLSR